MAYRTTVGWSLITSGIVTLLLASLRGTASTGGLDSSSSVFSSSPVVDWSESKAADGP